MVVSSTLTAINLNEKRTTDSLTRPVIEVRTVNCLLSLNGLMFDYVFSYALSCPRKIARGCLKESRETFLAKKASRECLRRESRWPRKSIGSNEDFDGFRNNFSKPRDFSSGPGVKPWVKSDCWVLFFSSIDRGSIEIPARKIKSLCNPTSVCF